LLNLQEAQAVREQVSGFKLDKSHTFSVNMFDEIDKYMRIPDSYEPPEDKVFQPTVSRPVAITQALLDGKACF
jgi:hypothetical protein